jgi:hypothetical protein
MSIVSTIGNNPTGLHSCIHLAVSITTTFQDILYFLIMLTISFLYSLAVLTVCNLSLYK